MRLRDYIVKNARFIYKTIISKLKAESYLRIPEKGTSSGESDLYFYFGGYPYLKVGSISIYSSSYLTSKLSGVPCLCYCRGDTTYYFPLLASSSSSVYHTYNANYRHRYYISGSKQLRVRIGDKTYLANDSLENQHLQTFKYDANGGTGTVPPTQTVWSGEGRTVTIAGNTLTKTGYIQDGWCTSSSGSGVHYKAGGVYAVTSAMYLPALYAKWVVPPADIPAGTYTPSSFKSLVTSFTGSTFGSYRTLANAVSVTVNGQTLSLFSGTKIYFVSQGSSPWHAEAIGFGVNYFQAASCQSSNGFSTYKAYIVLAQPSATVTSEYCFNRVFATYEAYNITVSSPGIKFK